MTIPLIGTGGYWTRQGAIARTVNTLNGQLGATATDVTAKWGSGGPTVFDLGTAVNAIEAQFQASNQQLVNGSTQGVGGVDIYAARDAVRSGLDGMKTALGTQTSGLASKVTVTMANDDVGLADPTSLTQALQELVRQMTNSSDTVLGPTVSVTPANGTPAPTGNPTVAASLKDPKGQSLDCVYNEVLDLVVTTDSFSGGATAGRETLSIIGDAAQADVLSWDWPKGSGASTATVACDSTENAGTNLLTNSCFDTFTVANTPDSWTVVAGSPGSTILQENSDVLSGTTGKALKFVGDGATLHQIKQEVTSLVSASGVYALNAFLHVGATAPLTGKLRFALVDGSGTVINDSAGTPNSYTVDCTQSSLQSTYKATGAMTTTELNGASLSGGGGQIFFRLPANKPTQVFMELKFTTALATLNGSVFVDHMALRTPVQAYGSGVAGGPYVAVFSAGTKTVVDDRYKVTVANDYGGAFAKWAWRTFNLPSLGIRIPSATGGNTINENLIA